MYRLSVDFQALIVHIQQTWISILELNFVLVLVAGGQSDDDKPRPDPALEAGNSLPPRLIDEFPPEYYSKPIEDIDPFYSNQYVSKHHSTSLAGDLHVRVS